LTPLKLLPTIWGSDIANDLTSKAMNFMASLNTDNSIEMSKAIGQSLYHIQKRSDSLCIPPGVVTPS
jgi:hypothetical protein